MKEFTQEELRAAGLRCVCPVDLHVAPNFTGRVVVHLKEGRAICDCHLTADDHITTLQGFIELAQEAGWLISPPKEVMR
ncbi:hypothetical protein [Atlantibacter sp.]|uniref:hypothetical protein n=1 Tax=Atlantibacter sp. TaxID=1903473 RepID=UPI0028A77047|nr:hypothetical protein [Atlantibacter sp.]